MPRKPNNSRQTRALLAAFLDRSRIWRHGYDLSKETGLRSGTLYPLLMRLSEQGLLESRCNSRMLCPSGSCSTAQFGSDSTIRSAPIATFAASRSGTAKNKTALSLDGYDSDPFCSSVTKLAPLSNLAK